MFTSGTSAFTVAFSEITLSGTRKTYVKSLLSRSVGFSVVSVHTSCAALHTSVIATLRSSDTGYASPFSSALTRSTTSQRSFPFTIASLSTSPHTCSWYFSFSTISISRAAKNQSGRTSSTRSSGIT